MTSTFPGDAFPATFELVTAAGCAAIRCGFCGSVSCLPGDIVGHYCGRCHLGHDVVEVARRFHADGATHECSEWRTARGVCAVCGRDIERRP